MKRTPHIGFRPTWAEVNLSCLGHNLRQVRRRLADGIKIMACVKADAYGHGLVPVAKTLSRQGVEFLSVASIDEAIALRRAGLKDPLLVLGAVLKKDISPLFTFHIRQTVCSEEFALALEAYGRRSGKRAIVHIKIDTGMGRIGVLHHQAVGFIKRVSRLKHVTIEGIFTHLACADTNRAFTDYQLAIFGALVSDIRQLGIEIPYVHAANSLGVTSYPHSHCNMVRPGLILYGLTPQENLGIPLKPVMSLKTRVVYVKRVPAGWGISYGHTYVTGQPANIATLPIGYGDGYPRNLSNAAPVIIRGKRIKISGRVCMDQVMIDVGNFPVKVGDEVVLIGSQGKQKVTTEELARLSGTIPYEIVCGLGSRVPRVYVV